MKNCYTLEDVKQQIEADRESQLLNIHFNSITNEWVISDCSIPNMGTKFICCAKVYNLTEAMKLAKRELYGSKSSK